MTAQGGAPISSSLFGGGVLHGQQEALRILDSIPLEVSPLRSLLARARLLEQAERITEAIKILNHVVERNPYAVEATFVVAVVWSDALTVVSRTQVSCLHLAVCVSSTGCHSFAFTPIVPHSSRRRRFHPSIRYVHVSAPCAWPFSVVVDLVHAALISRRGESCVQALTVQHTEAHRADMAAAGVSLPASGDVTLSIVFTAYASRFLLFVERVVNQSH
jgi:hypothetical protein